MHKYNPNPEQTAAIRNFAKSHGRRWKFELSNAWSCGADAYEEDGYLLRQVRNDPGRTYTWLKTFKVSKIPPQGFVICPRYQHDVIEKALKCAHCGHCVRCVAAITPGG